MYRIRTESKAKQTIYSQGTMAISNMVVRDVASIRICRFRVYPNEHRQSWNEGKFADFFFYSLSLNLDRLIIHSKSSLVPWSTRCLFKSDGRSQSFLHRRFHR